MAIDKKYRPVGRLVVRRIGKDNLLVPVSGAVAATNAVFPLNDTGLYIWENLIAGKTLEETAAGLCRVFSVSLDTARTDCRAYLDKLLAERLIEAVSP